MGGTGCLFLRRGSKDEIYCDRKYKINDDPDYNSEDDE